MKALTSFLEATVRVYRDRSRLPAQVARAGRVCQRLLAVLVDGGGSCARNQVPRGALTWADGIPVGRPTTILPGF
jgi:hypothetical protein